MASFCTKLSYRFLLFKDAIHALAFGINYSCSIFRCLFLKSNKTDFQRTRAKEHYFIRICKKVTSNHNGLLPELRVQAHGKTKVWVFWHQGWSNPPEIVRICKNSWQKYFDTRFFDLRYLSLSNIHDYIEVPAHIEQKYASGKICVQHYSDYVRFALLEKYGGLWMDATTFVCKDMDPVLFSRNTFYTLKQTTLEKTSFSHAQWTCFLLFFAQPFSKLASFTRASLEHYWKRVNEPIDYSFLDFIILAAKEINEEIRMTMDEVRPNIGSVWKMQKALLMPYQPNILDDLNANGDGFNKLSSRAFSHVYIPKNSLFFQLKKQFQGKGEISREATPIISVVIPVYNGASYISCLLQDLASQNDPSFEVVVINDGSTDGTKTVCERFANSFDSFTIITLPNNGGPGNARNIGTQYALGKYVLFLDGDDRIDRNFVLEIIRHCNDENDIICTNYCMSGKSPHTSITLEKPFAIKGKDCLPAFYDERSFLFGSPCFKAIKRGLALKHPFPVNCFFEDYCVMLPLIEDANRFYYTPLTKYHYLSRPDSTMQTYRSNHRMLADQLFSIAKRAEQILQKYEDNEFFHLELEKAFYRAVHNWKLERDPSSKTRYKECWRIIFRLFQRHTLSGFSKAKTNVILACCHLSKRSVSTYLSK